MNDELEKLLAEATPLPWGYDTLVFVDGQALLSHTDRLGVLTIPDAALIVAAVNALPELLAKVKRLEEALKPFAHAHDLHIRDDDADTMKPAIVQTGYFRAARAALQETKP